MEKEDRPTQKMDNTNSRNIRGGERVEKKRMKLGVNKR